MKTINEMKLEAETALENVITENKVLNTMVQYKGFEDYRVEANTSWTDTVITIQHDTFNWTNFLSSLDFRLF